MYIDICNSKRESEWAVAYHQQQKHKNIQSKRVTELAVSTIEGTDPNFKLEGIHFEMGADIWVVTAES